MDKVARASLAMTADGEVDDDDEHGDDRHRGAQSPRGDVIGGHQGGQRGIGEMASGEKRGALEGLSVCLPHGAAGSI